ncbi:polyisoprenoid-binding protein YceI [Idiomarina aquatica]|uniref:Polyisoprenoid-binding protein YceI n=1 Tax=Idiomarina aquatica TaxID=1327752 RepID=A0A4R6NYB6_9GAMM|nr:YceI family protein [Idiomarina aquatica]TDP28386.1 polyisoprenoid-binding protein YceI [Idiomarina aquatica]
MKKTIIAAAIASTALFAGTAQAEEYKIDIEGQHAFIQFKINHLGYSWLLGRFNEFDGSFNYDENAPEDASINVTIETASIDTNHAERDKHLRSDDFLNVSEFPTARFESTRYVPDEDDAEEGTMYGNFTLNSVTKEIAIDVEHVGAGEDPWGGFRRGFEGEVDLTLADYNIDYNLGPAAREVELYFSIEGVRQ